MTHVRPTSHRGFALLEALIALILILVGMVAVSQLQSASLFGAGEGRTRAEAAHLTQQKLEQLRNLLQKGEFTALTSSPEPDVVVGVNAKFETHWTVVPNVGVPPLEQHEVRVWTTWTDSRGVDQRFDLATIVAWDDALASAYPFAGGAGNPVAPTGAAQRGGELPKQPGAPVLNKDGTKIYTPDGDGTYLTDANDKVILFLPRKDDAQQEFTTITGRIFFDPDEADTLPAPADVLVRLSSEGECFAPKNDMPTVDADGKSYKYFVYTCYVGPGWYGNVGVSAANLPNNSKGINTCVGDPSITGGQPDDPTTLANWGLSVLRTYRGFKSSATASGVQSTGVQGGTQYGTVYDEKNGNTGPSGAASFNNHDFLLTDLEDKDASCKTKMPLTLFAGNAGKYVCITPDSDPADDVCPPKWPSGPSVCLNQFNGPVEDKDATVTANGVSCGNVKNNKSYTDCEVDTPAGTPIELRSFRVGFYDVKVTVQSVCGTDREVSLKIP